MAEILIVGGGVAGLAAAKTLSPFHKVTIVDTSSRLGGIGGTLSCKAGADCTVCTACTFPELIEEVVTDPNVTVRTDVTLEDEVLEADSVIVTTGLDVADGGQLAEYGAGRLDGVMTALDLDRALRTEGEGISGPEGLDIPAQGGRVAIVQCVCSRDTGELPYCSRVCCAYSARLALELRQVRQDLRVDVFYMDIQREDAVSAAQIDQAMADEGIEYIRSRPAGVQEVPGGGLEVLFEDTLAGEIRSREYDAVVLSTGLVPSEGTRQVARRLDLATDEHGFIATGADDPVRTSSPNVFAAGGATGPVDLVEASMGGMAAAAAVLADHPPEWPGYPPRVIVVGGGPSAEAADRAAKAAGADTSMVLGLPGNGLQRLEGEPLRFLARMGSPGKDSIIRLEGDTVIVAPDRGAAVYGPVPQEAASLAILVAEGPEALLLASRVMDERPGTAIHMLYRDMPVATLGMQELQLDLAERGVGFHRYGGKGPRMEGGNGGPVTVSFTDELVPDLEVVVITVDHVAVPTRAEAPHLAWPWFLSRYAPSGVPPGGRLNVQPVTTPRRGVYTTVPANATSTAAVLGGPAAAALALADYARGYPLMDQVAVVDPEKCAACLNCLRLCPHDAIAFDDNTRAALVMVRACQSCGMCAGICPGEAITMVPRDDLEVD